MGLTYLWSLFFNYGMLAENRKAVLSALLALFMFASHPAQAETPPPLKAGSVSPAEDCGACHKEVLEKWKDSMHAQSVTDPIFQAAYMQAFLDSDGRAKAVCLDCHAPVASINGDTGLKNGVTRQGITCHFCHSVTATHPNGKKRYETAVGKTLRGPRGGDKSGYHQSVKSDLHRSAEFCASCHEYTANGVKIMATWSEWKAGPYAAKGWGCQNCHMPIENLTDDKGNRKSVFSHSLAGGHSIVQLRKAMNVTIRNVQRLGDRTVVDLEVENAGAGHNLPTGIPTRKLLLYVQLTTADNRSQKKSIAYEKIIFDKKGRELTRDSDIMLGLGSQIVKDNRIAPGEKRKEQVVFYGGTSGEISVSTWIDYVYQPLLLQNTEMRVEMTRSERSFGR